MLPEQPDTRRWSVLLKRPADVDLGNGEVVPGVKFVFGNEARARIQAKLDAAGAGLRYVSSLGVEHAFSLETPAALSEAQVERMLSKLPDFVDVSPSAYTVELDQVPNDPGFSGQWGLGRINAPTAWDYTTGWAGAAIAVLDTGFNLSHSELDGNLWSGGGFDAANEDTDPTWAGNGIAHGTQVAGVLLGEGNNSSQLAGVSWRHKLMPVKVFDDVGGGNPDFIANGINWVCSQRQAGVNVRVINISASTFENRVSLADAIANAEAWGILVVASAGNVGSNNDQTPRYPASYTNANVIAVGATDNTDARAIFNQTQSSSFGANSVDLFAPGQSISVLNGNGTGTTTASGTSFSTPMVAGAAALLWSMKPDLTVAQVRAALLSTVDVPVVGTTPILNNLCVTEGILDVAAAVQAVSTGANKVFIGDDTTYSIADDVYIQRKPGDTTKTQILQFKNGSYTLYAEIANSTSKRIDVYTLGGADAVTVAANVLNPVYVGTSEGNDNLDASAATAKVSLYGEAGNDTIRGGAGNDTIEGGSGDDTIYGGAGANFVLAGSGDDYLYMRNSDLDWVYGGDGYDRGQRDGTESVWSQIELNLP